MSTRIKYIVDVCLFWHILPQVARKRLHSAHAVIIICIIYVQLLIGRPVILHANHENLGVTI